VVIATTAFGMGTDCPDIQKMIHFGTPGTIAEYVQETGHAGRDAQPAKACLLAGEDGLPKHFEIFLLEGFQELCVHSLCLWWTLLSVVNFSLLNC